MLQQHFPECHSWAQEAAWAPKHFSPPSKTRGANRTQLWMLCRWSKCRLTSKAPGSTAASIAHLGCMTCFFSSISLNCRRESSSQDSVFYTMVLGREQHSQPSQHCNSAGYEKTSR